MHLNPSNPALIFTDLDGSLLDHDNYSFSAAISLLSRLESENIPVIPTTSKTLAEVENLRIKLNNYHPFIIENGAGIAVPKNYFSKRPEGSYEKSGFWVIANTKPRQYWNSLLQENAKNFAGEFDTFSSIVSAKGYQGIQAITGLSLDQAALSNNRYFSEPIHWLGSDVRKKAFIKTMTKAGASLLQGGRFLSLSGDFNKGDALLHLTQLYQQDQALSLIHTLAIGDSNNDITMLDAASSAIIIRSKAHPIPTLTREKNVMTSHNFGPEGWAESVSFWLTNYFRNR